MDAIDFLCSSKRASELNSYLLNKKIVEKDGKGDSKDKHILNNVR